MRKSKLGLDFAQVDAAKQVAKNIAGQVQEFVDAYTTVAVERTLCRLIGIDGIDENGVPLPNRVVDAVLEKGVLNQGVLYFIGNAILETGDNPQAIAEKIAAGQLDITALKMNALDKIQNAIQPFIDACLTRIKGNVAKRNEYLNKIGEGPMPYLYVIVATGNIYEDVVQAQAAARQGAESSPLSVLPVKVCSTMYHTVQLLKASAVHSQPKRTSASCVRLSMK